MKATFPKGSAVEPIEEFIEVCLPNAFRYTYGIFLLTRISNSFHIYASNERIFLTLNSNYFLKKVSIFLSCLIFKHSSGIIFLCICWLYVRYMFATCSFHVRFYGANRSYSNSAQIVFKNKSIAWQG
jgi:hypothetical protein